MKYIIAFVVLMVTAFLCWYFKSIIIYIIISAVLSFLGRPIIVLLSKITYKGKFIPQSIRALISLIVLWMIFIGFFWIIIPLLISEIRLFTEIDINLVLEKLQGPLNKLEEITRDFSATGEGFNIKDYLKESLTTLIQGAKLKAVFGSVASTITEMFVAIFSISFITFFFLKDSSLFTRLVLMLVPDKYEEGVKNALDSIETLLVRYFVGILVQVTLIMILNIIGHSIVGIELSHAVVIGLFAGLMNVIPYIGPIIGTLLGISIGLAINIHLDFYNETIPILVCMTIVFMIVQFIDNFIFQPIIYGNSVHAHPLEIFIVILMTGSVAGVSGMILAIPGYTVLRVIAREFFNKYSVVKKITNGLKE